MKYLAIFDIDGTLGNTVGIDDQIFRSTLSRLFDVELSDDEWESTKLETTATDSGLFKSIYDKYIKNSDFQHELIKFKTTFTHYLRFELLHKKNEIKEVTGAKNILNELLKDSDFTVAIATGSWKYAGILKLQAINISPNLNTYSNAELFLDRKQIVQEAINISKKNKKDFKKITYFGDGLWDKLSAESLGINFVGVDSSNNGILKSYNSANIINNYNNFDQIKDFLIN